MASVAEYLKCNKGRCRNFTISTIINKDNHKKSHKNRFKVRDKKHLALFEYSQYFLTIYQFMPVLWDIVALSLFFVSLSGSATAAEAPSSSVVVVVTTELNVPESPVTQLQPTAKSISPPHYLEIQQVINQNNKSFQFGATTIAPNTINVPSLQSSSKTITTPTATTTTTTTTTTTLNNNISKTIPPNSNNDNNNESDSNNNNNKNNSIRELLPPLSSIIPREASSEAADSTNAYEMEIELGMAMGLDVPSVGAFTAATSIFDSQNINQLHNVSLASATSEANEETEIELPPLHTIIVSILLLLVIIGTVVGNVLVCIAVCMVRKLRRPCNYLLVSLALSDLCVAVLVMPIALLYEVLEKWNFGTLVCDIWVSFDVLCCTASILNLCAISVDRYLAITKPLEYGVKRTPRRMMLCVALVWLGAACISLPPLLILGNEHEGDKGEPICNVCQNFGYQIYATLGSFYIPLAVMLFVYYQIFRAARRIVLEEKRAQTHLQHALNGTNSPTKTVNTTTDICGDSSGSHLHLGGGTGGNGHRNSSFGNASLLNAHGTGSNLLGSPHQKKLRFQLAKEKKASTTLGIIMSAFTICWLPFFILALIRPFESTTYHVPQSITSLFLWLGYANSLLNPIIYATLNRDFRKPFQEILYFRCSSLNTMMRENYYHDQYGEPPSQRVMLGDERHGARESFL